jgi:hypothetical protein
MKLTPIERAAYTRGQHDGERGNPPQSVQYTGRQREIYQRGYGRGYDARYREDATHKRHGNLGLPRPRVRPIPTGPIASPDVEIGPRRGSDVP